MLIEVPGRREELGADESLSLTTLLTTTTTTTAVCIFHDRGGYGGAHQLARARLTSGCRPVPQRRRTGRAHKLLPHHRCRERLLGAGVLSFKQASSVHLYMCGSVVEICWEMCVYFLLAAAVSSTRGVRLSKSAFVGDVLLSLRRSALKWFLFRKGFDLARGGGVDVAPWIYLSV